MCEFGVILECHTSNASVALIYLKELLYMCFNVFFISTTNTAGFLNSTYAMHNIQSLHDGIIYFVGL